MRMEAGGEDHKQRLTLVFVPGKIRRYKEIYCVSCQKKVVETYDELAYVSDVDSISLIPDRPAPFGLRCQGTCHIWYDIKSLPGIYDLESTKMFFIDARKKRREVHCSLCKELFAVVTLGDVFGSSERNKLAHDDDGFVQTTCDGCEHYYDITTNYEIKQ